MTNVDSIVERLTDAYGIALFGIWSIMLALVWGCILYGRYKTRKAWTPGFEQKRMLGDQARP